MSAEIQHTREQSFAGSKIRYRSACFDCGWRSPSTNVRETAEREAVEHNDKEHTDK